MSYESPIKIMTQEMKTIFEGDVITAIQRYGIDVDKEELLRALKYDRRQYEVGFDDAMRSIVRCKDCVHSVFVDEANDYLCRYMSVDQSDPDFRIGGNWFCADGERRNKK